MKQSKLRRRRVFRYAILYFVMLVVFLVLIVGPVVAGKYVPIKDLQKPIGEFILFQPTGLNNDNTRGRTETGTADPFYSGVFKKPTATATGAQTSTRANE